MIVLDASAIVELLLNTERGRAVAGHISDPRVGLHVPHLLDVEVAQVLGRYTIEGDLDAPTAHECLDDLRQLDMRRWAHEPLLGRMWELRRNLTAYDAAYVALAEALDASLVTCDAKLARAPGIAGRTQLICVPHASPDDP